MTTIDFRTRMTSNVASPSTTSNSLVAKPHRGRELFADGMDRRTAAAHAAGQVQATSLVGDVIGGVVGGIASLVGGVVDAIGDGLGALARGDILGALANIPRGVINTFLGGIGLFTEIGLGLVTTVVDGVLGLFRR